VKEGAEGLSRMGDALDAARAKGGTLLKILNDFAGPLALASGAALGFALNLGNVVRQSELVRKSLESLAKMQLYRDQLKGLLGGLDAANRRLRETAEWAKRSPFSFDDAAVGARNLQVLTGGLLATRRGMDLVGDAAARNGAPFSDMAAAVGTLYDNLQNGRPADNAAQALANMGAVSQSTAGQIAILSASGADFSTMWRLVEGDLARSSGAMKTAANEIAGLQAKLSSTQERSNQEVGEAFEGGAKIGLESQIKSAEALAPVLKSASQVVGLFYAAWERVTGAVSVFASTIPGLRSGVVAVTSALGVAITALAVFSALMAVQGVIQFAVAITGWATASSAAAGAMGILARSVLWLGNATKLAMGPVGWAIGLLTAVAAACGDAWMSAQDYSKGQSEMRRSTEQSNAKLQDQIEHVRTLADRAAVLAAAYKGVADAQANLDAAKKEDRENQNPFKDTGKAVKDREGELQTANANLEAAVESGAGAAVALDEKRLSLAKERLELERQIRNEVQESVIGNLKGDAKQKALEERAAEKQAASAKADSQTQLLAEDRLAVQPREAALTQANDTLATATPDLEAKKKDLAAYQKWADPDPAIMRQKQADVAAAQSVVDNAAAQRDAAHAAIAGYQGKSEEYQAQAALSAVTAPGSGATEEEKNAAQMRLEQVRVENDPSRAATESAAAVRARDAGVLENLQGKAESGAADQEVAAAQKIAGLRGQGVERAREEAKIRLELLDQEQERLRRQAKALAAVDNPADTRDLVIKQRDVAREGALGKTPAQVTQEMRENAVARTDVLDGLDTAENRESTRKADEAAAAKRLDAEQKTAALRSEGIARAREESQIRATQLSSELEALERQKSAVEETRRAQVEAAANPGDAKKREALKTALAAQAATGAEGETVEGLANKVSAKRNEIVTEKANASSLVSESASAEREAALTLRRYDIERQIAGLKEEGYDRAVKEAALRKESINTEVSDLQNQRKALESGDRNKIKAAGAEGKTVAGIDAEIGGRRAEITGIDADLANQRRDGLRTKHQAEGELRAAGMENRGNKEGAARLREQLQIEQRILELKRQGLTNEEAVKLARAEGRETRRERLRNRSQASSGGRAVTADDWNGGQVKRANEAEARNAIDSIRVDSMTGIGGNSGGGEGVTNLLQKILDALNQANRGDVRDPSLQVPKWDTPPSTGPTSPF